MLAIVAMPCLERGEPFRFANRAVRPCRSLVGADLWLDEPGTVTFRFAGGTAQHYGRINNRVVSFPPGQAGQGSAKVAPPGGNTTMQLDWRTTATAPTLTGVVLRLDSGRSLKLAP